MRQHMSHPTDSYTPEGLHVQLDALEHRYAPEETPADRPHIFVYHLTIQNDSDRRINLLARKWVISYPNGQIDVIEGDKIVGKTPVLHPGDHFSYNSFHLTDQGCFAQGAFFGLDDGENRVHVRVPQFEMRIPDAFREAE
ncbi:MAG: ApaG protein [Puniceicoccaceae bacterium 5H]|nr:MAG: ApaG protein [Puniceicoccaceae bacterium 5H]